MYDLSWGMDTLWRSWVDGTRLLSMRWMAMSSFPTILLWMLMRDLDPRYVGLNYDIGHVTAKGGNGWRESIRAVVVY